MNAMFFAVLWVCGMMPILLFFNLTPVGIILFALLVIGSVALLERC